MERNKQQKGVKAPLWKVYSTEYNTVEITEKNVSLKELTEEVLADEKTRRQGKDCRKIYSPTAGVIKVRNKDFSENFLFISPLTDEEGPRILFPEVTEEEE